MGFIDPSVCHWRVPGEAALALSYPILWYRMYTVGLAGVSTETQLLHFLTFFFRYLCYPSELFGISIYNSAAKLWYIACSALTLAFLLIRQRSAFTLKPTRLLLSISSIVLIVSSLFVAAPIIILSRLDDDVVHTEPLGYLPVYTMISALKTEAPWNMSQFISVSAMIPQLVILFKGAGAGSPIALNNDEEVRKPVRILAGVDVWMWKYVVSVAAFRTFYVLHWIWRWNNEGYLDPTAQLCATLQLIVIYGFIIAIVIKSYRSNKRMSPWTPGNELANDVEKVPSAASIVGDDMKKQMLPTIVVTDVA